MAIYYERKARAKREEAFDGRVSRWGRRTFSRWSLTELSEAQKRYNLKVRIRFWNRTFQ